MSPDKQFAYMKRTIIDKISTWEDMYGMFDELVARAKDHPSFLTVSNAMFLMYAFLFAMREAPEEGDIKKLMERAIRILVYEGHEKLGVTFSIVTEEEFFAEAGKQLAETIVGVATDVAIAQAQAEKPKGPLH